MTPSARARALIEALHEPTSNEERWEIAERFLGEAYRLGYRDCDAGVDPRPLGVAD